MNYVDKDNFLYKLNYCLRSCNKEIWHYKMCEKEMQVGNEIQGMYFFLNHSMS